MSVGEYTGQGPTIWSQGLFDENVAAQYPVGTVRCLEDGRAYVYAKMGGTAGAAGRLYQNVAPVTNHLDMTPAVTAIDAQTVTVTLGATLASVNQYKNGWLVIRDVTGEGYAYKIRSHPAAASAATLLVSLYDKVRVALDATTKVDLCHSPGTDVILATSASTGVIAGVATFVVTAAYYCWLQVKGPCAVWTTGTVITGGAVEQSQSVDGSVDPFSGTASIGICGNAMTTVTTTDNSLINLAIPGY